MRTYYFFVISGFLIVVGILLWPSLHLMIGALDTTGFYPLLKGAVVLLPWAFLFFVGYAIKIIAKK